MVYTPTAWIGGTSGTEITAARQNNAESGIVALHPGTGRNVLTGWWHADGYGATGNNSTDDTAAIQAAIDACSAAGGG